MDTCFVQHRDPVPYQVVPACAVRAGEGAELAHIEGNFVCGGPVHRLPDACPEGIDVPVFPALHQVIQAQGHLTPVTGSQYPSGNTKGVPCLNREQRLRVEGPGLYPAGGAPGAMGIKGSAAPASREVAVGVEVPAGGLPGSSSRGGFNISVEEAEPFTVQGEGKAVEPYTAGVPGGIGLHRDKFHSLGYDYGAAVPFHRTDGP